MQYIAATELRTKTPQLIETLKQGNTVNLLYRSQVVGKISPIVEQKPKKSLKETLAFFKKLTPSEKKLTGKEGREDYNKHLEEQYG
jgi:antitoxin (DNA-binding transcriptional repressor) of toxin-antitoxin stability system